MEFSELLSGFIGALIATLLSIWYQHSTEAIRNRKYVMIAVNNWLDDIYLRLQLLCGQKEKFIKQKSLLYLSKNTTQ
ncbi:MAG: hypothetical protein JO131_03610 [Gammaproteobacteria bacterium]|nr:hypothetical protein [Gammaproteobacteria bacterium]